MLWAIRGTDAINEKDITLVVEATSRAEAECMAIRRNFPVVIIEPATDDDIVDAKHKKLLYTASKATAMPYTAFGRPVGRVKLAFLMFCGIATALVVLKQANIVDLPLAQLGQLLDKII
jgi:hypothetical protein